METVTSERATGRGFSTASRPGRTLIADLTQWHAKSNGRMIHQTSIMEWLPFLMGKSPFFMGKITIFNGKMHYMGLSENVGLIFPMIASHFSWRDHDQQNHSVFWGTQHFQTNPYSTTTQLQFGFFTTPLASFPIFRHRWSVQKCPEASMEQQKLGWQSGCELSGGDFKRGT